MSKVLMLLGHDHARSVPPSVLLAWKSDKIATFIEILSVARSSNSYEQQIIFSNIFDNEEIGEEFCLIGLEEDRPLPSMIQQSWRFNGHERISQRLRQIAVLGDRGPSVSAIRALAPLKTEENQRFLLGLIRSRDTAVVTAVIDALSESDTVEIPKIKRYLSDASGEVRLAAFGYLKQRSMLAILNPRWIRKLRNDPNPEVRMAAASWLNTS